MTHAVNFECLLLSHYFRYVCVLNEKLHKSLMCWYRSVSWLHLSDYSGHTVSDSSHTYFMGSRFSPHLFLVKTKKLNGHRVGFTTLRLPTPFRPAVCKKSATDKEDIISMKFSAYLQKAFFPWYSNCFPTLIEFCRSWNPFEVGNFQFLSTTW